jgi:DNA-binding IclR family transcriptional regulator
MELFGELRRPLRAIEVSRQLGMHPSTTDQLLKTLVDSAHLQFDSRTMSYRPSPRLLDFARWSIDVYGPNNWLRDLVRTVATETDLVATLTTPNDLFMQVIDMVRPEGLRVERGQRIFMFGSATGSAYLSTLADVEVERLAGRARIAAAEVTAIAACLGDIRREGYADGANVTDAADGVEPMWSIAMPIPQGQLPFPIVLGLSGPAGRVQAQRGPLAAGLSAAIAQAERPEDGGEQGQVSPRSA